VDVAGPVLGGGGEGEEGEEVGHLEFDDVKEVVGRKTVTCSTVGRDSRAPFEPFVHPRSTTPQKPSPVQPALTSRLKGQEFVDVEDAAASRALKGLVDVASDLVVHGVSYTFNNDQCEPSSVYRTGLRRTSSTPNHT
jgi:hypothetical protein